MSKFSTIYDTILSVVPTLAGFDSKTRIPNAYSLADNATTFLEDGWGLRVNGAVPGDLTLLSCPIVTNKRTFGVILTRKLYSVNNDNEQLDNIVKAMAEDMTTLLLTFEDCEQLGVDESIEKIDFINDSGIQYLYKDDLSFLVLQINFTIEISEEN